MADPAMNGWAAEKAFDGCQSGYAYDDVVFLPGHVSFEASEVDVQAKLTRNISVQLPLVGGALDSLTEAEMATALAVVGSMGIVHGNQSVASQVDMIKRVKRHIGGFILEPLTLGPTNTLADLDKLSKEQGVGSVPITDDGKLGGKLIGWVGARDSETSTDRSRQLQHIMIRKVTQAKEPLGLEEAMNFLRKSKVGKLPIVDDEGRLVTLVTRSDLKKIRDNPNMSRTTSGQLLVGAAVPVGTNDDWERATELIHVGTDMLFVDCTGCSGEPALQFIRNLKSEFPKTEVLAGPATSCREAKRMVEAGADGIVAGCSEPPGGGLYGGVSSVGRPEATAIFEISRYIRLNYKVPVVAGPGVQNVGQMLKAFALGASAVLLGDPLAGADEAPGKQIVQNGSLMKLHHSMEPMGGVRQRLAAKHAPDVVPRHVSRMVPCQGAAGPLVQYMLQGIKNGMQDLGLQSVPALHRALDDGDLRLEVRSQFALRLAEQGAQAFRLSSKPEVMPFFLAA